MIESDSAWNEASTMLGGDADREPAVAFFVAAFDQNAGGGSRAAIEDTHLVVGEFEIGDEALIFAEILAQRHVKGIDRAIAFAGIDIGSRRRS